MQRIASFLVPLFLLVPVAYAATGAVLPDLSPVDTVLDEVLSEQDRQDAAQKYDEADELFPEVPSDSAIGEHREERIGDFLTIRIGVKNIVLVDVPIREWFAPYVRYIAELKLISGYRDAEGMPTGRFGPADPVTLEQMAKVAVLAVGIDMTTCPVSAMNPTSSGSWSSSYVGCAEASRWAVFSDLSADVHRPATRQEVVMTILQAFRRELDVDPSTLTFTDVEKTSVYAPAIAKASADAVVSGYTTATGALTGMFGPTNNVTRAEFSKIVTIALQIYKK